MRYRLVTVAILSLSFAGTAAKGQTRTEVVVHVERSVPQAVIVLRFPQSPPISFGRPVEQNAFYRTYRQIITWPQGNRPRRSDFTLNAKVEAGNTNTYYLRLAESMPRTEIYVFNRRFAECEWQDLSAPGAPDDIFSQLATAEGMLTVPTPARRCSRANLQRWTRVWTDRIKLLWRDFRFIGLNPNVIRTIQSEHQRHRLQLPRDFQDIVNLDRSLSSQFDR